MSKTKVLFVCIHNSARSQMAEALLKKIGGDAFEVESAGLEPGKLNPLAIEAMSEMGIDISKNPTKKVVDIFEEARIYHYVITVCDETSAERCPVFPGIARRLQWSFEDPSGFTGTPAQRLALTIGVRKQIEARVREFAERVWRGEVVEGGK